MGKQRRIPIAVLVYVEGALAPPEDVIHGPRDGDSTKRTRCLYNNIRLAFKYCERC